jgi:RNA polymerase-binding transcription factor DksA
MWTRIHLSALIKKIKKATEKIKKGKYDNEGI